MYILTLEMTSSDCLAVLEKTMAFLPGCVSAHAARMTEMVTVLPMRRASATAYSDVVPFGIPKSLQISSS